MIAWNEERKVTVTFGLERIEALKKQKSKFEIQKNFNPDLFFKYSIGITENTSSPEIVRVSFDAYAGRYLISQPLHPSQKIVEESPERVVLEWKILITEEVYSFILSHGNRAQVLSPEGLKGEIKSRLKQAITFY